MFKKIVLPLDLTDKHDAVLRIAVDLAKQGGAEVMLLHVIELIAGLPPEEDQQFYNRLEKLARGVLPRWGKALDEHKIRWQLEVVFGNRAQETALFAARSKADLIILTAPRLDPSNPASGWASLSFKVSVLAECPVLLVK